MKLSPVNDYKTRTGNGKTQIIAMKLCYCSLNSGKMIKKMLLCNYLNFLTRLQQKIKNKHYNQSFPSYVHNKHDADALQDSIFMYASQFAQ